MAMFSQQSLSELREKIDLVELISGFVKLTKSGATYKGLCPFHKEKSPSFLVRTADTHYHCFGCSAHGDAISFLMELEKFSFVDAVEFLSQKFNVVMDMDEERGQDHSRRREYRRIMQEVSEFFHYCLLHTKEGKEGLEYLYQRGFNLEFIKRFKIGWSLREDTVVMGVFKKIAPSQEDLLTLGLIKQANQRLRPFFYNRVMFPILDEASSPVGFTARIVDDTMKAPKYVNTPETPLFKKSKMLFGLFASRSRIIKEKRALVVEGQIDALRLIDEGFDYVVASQGTAFGVGHVEKLKRLEVRQVYLCFDSDKAGREAAIKVGNLLQNEAIEVFIMKLEEGQDPDTLLIEKGAEGFKKLMQQGVDFFTFAFDELSQKTNLKNPAAKQQLANELLKLLEGYKEPLMKSEAIKIFAQRLDVDPTFLHKGQVCEPIKKRSAKKRVLVDERKILQRDLLRALLLSGHKAKHYLEAVKRYIAPEDFASERVGSIYKHLLKVDLEGSFNLMQVFEGLEGDLFVFAQKIIAKKIAEGRIKEVLENTLQKLLDLRWMQDREKIVHKLEQKGLDEESVLQLAKEFDTIKKNRPIVEL
jgi:DNA primase